ncbi:MAG: hypothetical protein FJX72_00330 [Armatimonadetes bacterium]|nr:hypothetical protein [Armatimonadota bacterium]
MLKATAPFALLAVLAAAPSGAGPLVVHVAPGGRDAWSGLAAVPGKRGSGPVATLERARDVIRAMRASGPLSGAARIVVHPGAYRLRRTLALTERDSDVWIEASRPGTATVTGSAPVRGWTRVRPGLYVADLAKQGFSDFRFRELFLRGRRQVLARFPNRDSAAPLSGGFLYVHETASREKDSFHFRPGQIPWTRWGDRSQAEVNLFPYHCWDHNIIRIADVADDACRIELRHPVAGTIQVGNRYFIQNVRGALDAPGEWYCDRRTGELTFRPPDGRAPADGEVTVPVIENLIELSGTPAALIRNVRIAGLRLTGARMDAVTLEGARNCSVIGCSITGVGGIGVNVGLLRNASKGIGLPWRKPGGISAQYHSGDRALLFSHPCEGCKVAGNDIVSVGGDAVVLRGERNVADNNRISANGLYDMVCAAVTVCGDENRVSHNTIHDTPRDGVFVSGGRNVIERNDIRRAMMNTADNAAIALRQHNPDLAMAARGNVIRHNRIRDVVGYGCFPHCTHPGDGYAAPFCGFGIYLDSYISGVTVAGNLIARCGGPNLFIQFGGDNTVENNIVVQGPSQRLQFDSLVLFGTFLYGDAAARHRPSVGPNVLRRNVFVDASTEGVLYRVGHWDAATRSDPAQALFENNLVWRFGKPVRVVMHPSEECRSWGEWQQRGQDAGSTLADPMFVDAARDDYRLKPGSPAAALGLGPVVAELSRAGVYRSPDRASWPVVVPARSPERHRSFRFPPSSVTLIDGFETTDPGSRPRRWQVATDPPASVQVTREQAKTGSNSLKIADAPGQAAPWQPHIYMNPPYTRGRIRFSASFCSSPTEPADYYVEMRDWSAKLLVGPTFRVDRDGVLWANGRMGSGGTRVADTPHGRWYTVAMEVDLVPGRPTEWKLTLDAPGKSLVSAKFPVPDPEFRAVTWLGLSSTGTERSVFYVDDVTLGSPDAPAVAGWRSAASVRGTRRPAAAEARSRGAEGLVADWPMDDPGLRIRDVSGNGLDGSQGGAERAMGAFGRALRIGSGGHASFGDPPALRFGKGSFTLECWMMPETLEIASEHRRRRVLEKSAYPASGWVLDIWADGRAYLEMTDSALGAGVATSEAGIRAGRWTHVVVSVDRDRRKVAFIFDGKLNCTRDLPASFAGALDVEGAAMQSGSWQPLAGLLAGVRVYRTALSEGQAAVRWAATRSRYSSPAFRALDDD